MCWCLFYPGEVKARTFLAPHLFCGAIPGCVQILVPSLPGVGKYPGPGLVGKMLGPGEVKATGSFLQRFTVSTVLSGSSSGLPVPLPLLPVSCTALQFSSFQCSPVSPLGWWAIHWTVTSQQASMVPWVIIAPQAPLPLGSISPVPGNALWSSPRCLDSPPVRYQGKVGGQGAGTGPHEDQGLRRSLTYLFLLRSRYLQTWHQPWAILLLSPTLRRRQRGKPTLSPS